MEREKYNIVGSEGQPSQATAGTGKKNTQDTNTMDGEAAGRDQIPRKFTSWLIFAQKKKSYEKFNFMLVL